MPSPTSNVQLSGWISCKPIIPTGWHAYQILSAKVWYLCLFLWTGMVGCWCSASIIGDVNTDIFEGRRWERTVPCVHASLSGCVCATSVLTSHAPRASTTPWCSVKPHTEAPLLRCSKVHCEHFIKALTCNHSFHTSSLSFYKKNTATPLIFKNH